MNRSTAKKPRRLSWWVRPLWPPFEIVVAIVATVVLGYCIGRMW